MLSSSIMKILFCICCTLLCFIPSFSFLVVSPRSSKRFFTHRMAAAGSDDSDEPDLFDYFDPLLSPHAYPDGIDPDHKPNKDKKITQDDREKPTRLHKRSVQTVQDPTQVFDPTLSPHAYPDGTPSALAGDNVEAKKKVGILLIDHGSKKQASNDRLQELARIYQKSADSNVVVRAAHMEIAEPSIPVGLEALLNEGVGKYGFDVVVLCLAPCTRSCFSDPFCAMLGRWSKYFRRNCVSSILPITQWTSRVRRYS